MRRTLSLLFLSTALAACGADQDKGQAPPTGHFDGDHYTPLAAAEVYIDPRGIPHIFGRSDHDAFYAAGYQMASDRLFQMEMTRRRAVGRMSEVLGSEGLVDDEIARLFNWRTLGKGDAALMETSNPDTLGIIRAWVSGVNRRITELREGELPRPWGFGSDEYDFLPEDWSPTDPLTIGRMIDFGNDLSLEYELFATILRRYVTEAYEALDMLRPSRPAQTVPESSLASVTDACWSPAIGARSRPLPSAHSTPGLEGVGQAFAQLRERFAPLRVLGSNNWAVDGRFTQNGRPLIAGDPHQGFDFPGVFYGLHINSKDAGGRFDVAGMSFTGIPGISMGQTDKLIWTVTTALGDVMDIWDIAIEGSDEQARVGNMLVPVQIRYEQVTVRRPGGEVGEGRQVAFAFRDVEGYGVLLPDDLIGLPIVDPGRALLLNWTGFRAQAKLGLLDLNMANSIEDFEQSVDQLEGSNFNFVAADAEGISYRVGLNIPRRDLSSGQQPWLVLDGDDPNSFWTGELLDRDRLPRGRGQGRGWVATANNDPFGFTANGRLDDDPWYYGAFFAPGWRAQRIEDELGRLTQRGEVTFEDMRALQLDTHSNLADDLLPGLAAARAVLPQAATLESYRDRAELAQLAALLLEGWDRQMVRDSHGALVFHAYAHFLASRVLEDDLGLFYDQILNLQAVYLLKLVSLVVRGETGEDLLQQGAHLANYQALEDTFQWLRQRFEEPAAATLADAHHARFDGSMGAGLFVADVPSDGGESTVNVSPSKFLDRSGVADQWVSQYGPLVRLLGRFDDEGNAELFFNAPLGNVADPASPHFSDGSDSWSNGGYQRMLRRRSEVAAAAESHYTLQP